MTAKWIKRPVTCAQCEAKLMRRLFRPKDGKAIVRFFCDRSCKGSWQRDQKAWSRDWLFEQYVVRGRTANEIAAEVGRDAKRVWEWIRDYGIQTRPRGSHEPNLFKRGHRIGVGRVIGEAHREAIRQARKRDGSKGLFPNGVHVLKGRTGARHPSFRGGLTPERQAFYGSEEWKLACAAVWRRADAKCERCGLDHRTIDRRTVPFHIHHIVTFQVRELRATVSNLVLLCRPCHVFVHSRRNLTGEYIRDAA
jgi:hypothetical protein